MALEHDFYGMLPNCTTRPPPENGGSYLNADEWVQNQVHSGQADFGVCDPCVLQARYDRVLVVGGLVTGAAFWVVTKGLSCPDWDHLVTAAPDRLLVYPEGMTGHRVYQRLARKTRRYGDAPPWPDPTPVQPHDDINDLRESGGKTVLITPNIAGALRLRRESPEDYEVHLCCSTYPGYPNFGHIVTSGIIAQTPQYDPEEQVRNRLKQFVAALQYALVHIRRRPDKAAGLLSSDVNPSIETQDANDAVHRMLTDEIWPHHLRVSRSAWQATLDFHGTDDDKRMARERALTNEYADSAYSRHVLKWARWSEPTRRYQVFISSTYQDLRTERREVAETLRMLGHNTVGMEIFPGESRDAWEVIKNFIDESDVYVLLIANRYGSLFPDSDVSWTEHEFDYALEKRGSSWIYPFLYESSNKREYDDWHRLHRFRRRVQRSTYGRDLARWRDVEDLQRQLKSSLASLGRQDGRGFWIRHEEEPEVAATRKVRSLQSRRRRTLQVDGDSDGGDAARHSNEHRSLADRLTEGLMDAYTKETGP